MIRYESQIGDKLETKNWNKQSYSNSNLLHLKLIPKGNIWEIRHSSAWHMRNTQLGSFPNYSFEVAKRYYISKFSFCFWETERVEMFDLKYNVKDILTIFTAKWGTDSTARVQNYRKCDGNNLLGRQNPIMPTLKWSKTSSNKG